MQINLPSLYLTLQAAQPVTIAGAIDTEIRVLEGRIWLTEEGVAEDTFLFPGASYKLRTSGRVVLDCDSASRIVVHAPVSVRTAGHRLGELVALGRAVFRRLGEAVSGNRGSSIPREYQGSL
jgi:hypothetical protein